MKSLEEYFQDQPLLPEDVAGAADPDELSAAEQAFLSKYLGMDDASQITVTAIPPTVPEQVVARPEQLPQAVHQQGDAGRPKPEAAPLPPDYGQRQQELREQSVLQLIGFRLADQEYALPIDVIQEVIRAVEPTRLPSAPVFLSGVINLRGKVTPLISLRTLLGLPADKDRFVVVCRHAGLQMGLQIQTVTTMHRIGQDRIDWGVESLLGVHTDFIAGLIRAENRRLIGILSLHDIVQTLLKTS